MGFLAKKRKHLRETGSGQPTHLAKQPGHWRRVHNTDHYVKKRAH